MKRRLTILCVIATLMSLTAHGQVFEMFYQGFEPGSPTNWNATGTYSTDNSIAASGSQCIKLTQSRDNDVELFLDTIDFTQNTQLRFITLEFDHINNIATNSGSDVMVGVIYVKLARDPDTRWQQLTSQNYNTDREVYSTVFTSIGTFNKEVYSDWVNLRTPTNDNWKSERFDLNSILTASVPQSDRKLIFKFVTKKKTSTGNATGTSWWIDNIRVRASQNQIVSPRIKMLCYPDGGDHPSSRGARVSLRATTSVSQGIAADSVFIFYRKSSDSIWTKQTMSPVASSAGEFTYRVPFMGYDTLMDFYCQVKDATTNHNEVSYPNAAGSFVTYRCVRGQAWSSNSPTLLGDNNNRRSEYFPFSGNADMRCEMVYDSALLANAGYKAGGITSLTYTVATNVSSTQRRPNFQIWMKNIPNNYESDATTRKFTTSYMQVVYDTTFVSSAVGAGTQQTINFTDTFFYAGKDILMHIIYDGDDDGAATPIRTIAAPSTKKTIYVYDGAAAYGYNAYTGIPMGDDVSDDRAAFSFGAQKNMPLVYDMGVSGFSYPNATTAMTNQPNERLVVWLKNYGANPVNAIRISYLVDETISGHFDWTGTINGGDSIAVEVCNTLQLAAGYHSMKAWVEDTLTSASVQWRDHEPFNDTSATDFVVCAGAMHGTRTVGTPTSDYETIEQFLNALSLCGISDSLIVTLAPGTYNGFTVPTIPGLSTRNYLLLQGAPNTTVNITNLEGDMSALIDLTQANHIRFRNLNFYRTRNAMTNMVQLSGTSSDCQFLDCTFTDSIDSPNASLTINALINGSSASSLKVVGCTFHGGNIGVNLVGLDVSQKSQNQLINNCVFDGQTSNALYAANQSNLTISNCEMTDVSSNSSYVALLYQCDGTVRFTGNKLYTSHGAGALGVSSVEGTSANRALIANNMIVCNDDGLSTQITTPFNIIQGNWIDVVYNSVKLTARERTSTAAATFGGGTMTNCRFMNNIVACMDDVNYAFNYLAPADNGNLVNHNLYFSNGYTLNRRTGVSFDDLAAWQSAVTEDDASQSANPGFLNSTPVDLRTYIRVIKGLATPISQVTTDMFGTARDASRPCAGAFEFATLQYDFEPIALLQPLEDNCAIENNTELILQVANTGSNRYTYGGTTLRIGCKINNNAEQYATVTQTINSDDTVNINTGIRLTMPPNGLKDSTYAMRIWVSSTSDPNKTNDTMDLAVISRYHATAPTRIESSVEYFERDTIVPTAGINMWAVYSDPTAPKKRSTLYWYRNITDTVPMHIGDTLITDPLRVTQDFFMEQRRQVPVVRLTQIQLFRGVGTSYVGLTEPYPDWLASSVRVVAQITNVGDAPANLTRDTLQTISTSSLLNNKICGFTGITLQPGQSMTVQYLVPSASTPVNPEKTIYAGATLVMADNNNLGFVYRREGVIEDAVAFKDLVTAGSALPLKWADLNIPSYVWGSQGVPITSSYVSGFIRVAFNGDSTDWVAASNERRMTLGEVDSSIMMFTGNGCPGDKGTAHVVVTRAPSTDLELDNLQLPTGCGLGLEDITVTVHNYGTVTVNRYTLNYNGGGATVSELVTTPIAAGDSLIYTFNTKLNMNVSYDSTFFVKVWSSNVADDHRPENDTTSGSTFVNFTPSAPVVTTNRTINYGTSDTITITAPSNAMPLWYNFDGNVSDTGYTFITGNRYTEGTIGVSYMAMTKSEKQLGNTQTKTTKTEYPSAFQTYNKLSKQQYIYTAAELTAMGLQPGPISAVAFYQDSLCDVNVVTRIDSITVADFYIHMGLTTDTFFAARNSWKPVSQVMYRSNLRFYKRNNHKWVKHEFDTPIIWDGTSNVVVQVAMQNTAAITSGIQSTYNTRANSVLYIATNNSVSPSLLGYVSNGLPQSDKRPDIRLTGTDYACEGPRTNIRITPIGTPQIDACISWPNGYDTATYASCGNVSLPITISNLGLGNLNNAKIVYYVDNAARKDTIAYTNVLHGGDSVTLPLFSLPLEPGRHFVHAYVIAENDDVHNNDTLSRLFKVRFCGGVYTVGGQTPDFDRFSKLIDTLNVVGIAGPVRIDIRPGVYTEQIYLGNIEGSSTNNTLTFHGENDSVFLRVATTQANNYVLKLNGASNVILDRLHLVSRPPTVQFGDVLVIQNASNIVVRNSHLTVKGTLDNFNSSCIVLNGNVSKLNVENNVIDSGYYSIHHAGAIQNYQNITISNNTLQNFTFHGINLRGLSGLEISGNYITSGMIRSNRNLAGVYIANTTGKFLISKNQIYLIDAMNGGKSGIKLSNIVGINQQWGRVSNNMISCQHNCNPAQNLSEQPNGIRIDSSSAYVNICFNTVRINATGANQYNTMSSSLYSGATNSHLIIMNNILANYGSGFAYDVRNGEGITTSNYNAYYTEGNVLALWNSQFINNLDTLQTRNNMDIRSLEEAPYFVNDTNLHLVMTNFVTKAQYNPDVIDDIDGNTRPQIPAPTIGAHEMQRNAHDMTIVKIESPKMPENRNNPLNIESDSILVKVLFYNNGNSMESTVQWYAYMTNYRDTTGARISQSITKTLYNVPAGELFMDSILVPSPLGIIDTHMIHVEVIIGEDDNMEDNYMKTPVYLAPAYNLEATRMIVPSGCNLEEAVIQITLKNVGFKQFLPGDSIRIGYHTQGYYPSCATTNLNANKINIRTMIDTVEETIILTEPIIENETKVFEFVRKANLYPTDTLLNIKVRVDGWCKHLYDILTDNNATTLSQTSSPIVDAFYTPNPPHGFDTTFAYGTWGRVRSSQDNLPSTPLAVRWYRDTLSNPFYTNANYNTSRWWNNTPQFFHDSVYYLNCISAKNCTSKFSPVRVSVAPPMPNDLSVEAIIAPLGNRVYMQNDTVRLRIINYGTQTQSNFPLAYQLRRNNAVLQTVTETYPGSIQPGQTVIYTFDSLLMTNSPTTAQAYTLKVWTDLANDDVRRNDTLRMPYNGGNTDPGQQYGFTSISPSAALCVPGSNFEPGMLDISRVSFNCIDFDISSIGRTYTDLADYPNPEERVLHVTRGMTDSLIVELNNINDIYSPIAGDISVFIDLDRSGNFDATERVISPTTVIATEQKLATRLTIPNNASYGYMRMRVIVQPEGASESTGCPTSGSGHAIDFLLFVDKEAVSTDLAFTRIVSPRKFSIPDDDSASVSFYVYNKGTQPVNEFEYMCMFEADNPDSSQFVRRTWTGNLASNSGMVITLPYFHFPYGVTKVQIFHSYPNDSDTANNHIEYEYVRFHSVTLRMNEMFDSLNYWYAPSGRNAYTKNYWQLGAPHKSVIYSAYSAPNAWVTDLANPIVSGKRGNASYLYSPIIDISQVRPDTIIFRLLRNLVNNSTLHLEYLNYQGHWTKLQHDSMVTFYNNEENMVFDGTSSGYTYNRYWMRTTTNHISSEFPEKLQFRFVYRTPEGSSTGSSFGDGCALDNFYIGRAQRAIDVGVIAITQPQYPRFGEQLYPQVVVKNYGYDTVRNMQIGYTHYGANLAKINEITCNIAPGATDTFSFTTPFLVTSDFPTEFEIEAFTQQPLDIYWDNDTLRQTFMIAPLDHDIAAINFVQPLERVIAGDTQVAVSILIRNFGLSEIPTATATLDFNGRDRAVEIIDFNQMLGRPLESMEFFNYTFRKKFRASMGMMDLTAFIKSDSNDYIYNDTITHRINGISSIMDIAAAGVIADSSKHGTVQFELIIENRGARGANNFDVGFWIDNDTTTMVRETYYRDLPIPALSTASHLFNVVLPMRSTGYRTLSGYVHINNDNDRSNDTTNRVVEQYFDLAVDKVIVEENANPDCRVFIKVTNVGNLALDSTRTLQLRGTVNGTNLSYNIRRQIDPGQSATLQFPTKIEKSPLRRYIGTGRFILAIDVMNTDNNQTSVVEVVNYVEGVPTLSTSELDLGQNYPNPFSNNTVIPFSIPNSANVSLFIMDIMGKKVYESNQFYPAGDHAITINMDSYPTGIYYYGIEVDGDKKMKKMILR